MIGLFLAAAAQLALVPTPAVFDTDANIQRMDDSSICQAVRRVATRVSAAHPAQIDGAGRLDRITVVCAMREVSFNQAGIAGEGALTAESQVRLDQSICRSAVFNQIVQRGWTLSTSITAPDGGQAFRDIDCAAGSGPVSALR